MNYRYARQNKPEQLLAAPEGAKFVRGVCMYVCMVITYSRVWINRVRLPILLVVS